MLTIALSLVGLWAATRLPLELIPTFDLPRLLISASWPGASPRAVERQVTAPLERVVRGVPGLGTLTTFSRQGGAALEVEIGSDLPGSTGMGLGHAWMTAEVSDRLAAAAPTLPTGVVPHLTAAIPEAFHESRGFMTLQVSGSRSPASLRRHATERWVPLLRGIPGIASVEVEGGVEEEVSIELSASRMGAHGIAPSEVQARVSQLFRERFHGRLVGGDLLMGSVATQLDALLALPLSQASARRWNGLVRLGDVAEIRVGESMPRSLSRVDGLPFVTLRLERAPGSHLLEVAAAVRQQLEKAQKAVVGGAKVEIAEDRSEQVRRELREMGRVGGVSLGLVLAVLVLALRSGRGVALVLLGVCGSLAAALILMYPLGLTLNLLTLAGLLLVVGLLVDNGVVVVERLLVAAPSGRGAGEIWSPLAAGTATTVAILVPLLYLESDLRALFVPVAALLAATLVASLAIFRFLVGPSESWPSRTLASTSKLGRRSRRGRRAQAWRWVGLPYGWVAANPGSSLVVLLLLLGLPTPLIPGEIEEPAAGWPSPTQARAAERWNASLGSELALAVRAPIAPWIGGVTKPFLETVERGERWDFRGRPALEARIRMPEGSGPRRVDEVLTGFEEEALAAPGVEKVLLAVSADRGHLRVLFDEGLAEGASFGVSASSGARSSTPFELRQRFIHRAMGLAGLEVSVSGLVSTSYRGGIGVVSGRWVEARGPSFEGLLELCEELAARLRSYPRVADVQIRASRFGAQEGRQVATIDWGADATARSGWWADEVVAELRSHLDLDSPSAWIDLAGRSRLPIRIRSLPDRVGQRSSEGASWGGQGKRESGLSDLASLSTLAALPLAGPGGPTRLASFAELDHQTQSAGIERRDQQYRRFLRIFFQGPTRLADDMLDQELPATKLPSGYVLERSSRVFLSEDVQSKLLALLAAAGFWVFLILAAVFESWRLPWLVLASLPTAFVGVAVAFLVVDAPFSEGAFLGSILLVGVSVNDSILLVDGYRRLQLRHPGREPRTLGLLALRRRWRPMWTTTATSVAGMVPLVVFADRSDFWLGLAVTVIGGLLASTLLAPMAVLALLGLSRRASSGLSR